MNPSRRSKRTAKSGSGEAAVSGETDTALRAVALQFVEKLLANRESVRNGAPGELRDAKAHESLIVASMLFGQLAGWARDHVVGRVLAGISAAAYAKGTTVEMTLGRDRPWDDPKLEKSGAAYDFSAGTAA